MCILKIVFEACYVLGIYIYIYIYGTFYSPIFRDFRIPFDVLMHSFEAIKQREKPKVLLLK